MSHLDPLTRLAIRHGTDKWGAHFYTPVYHQLFAARRDEPVRLLEIGVGGYAWARTGGASLAMWAEYFPLGRIVGLDIAKKDLDLGPRVSVVQGSQSDPLVLKRLAREFGPFDIVIDDGSHVPADVVATFDALISEVAEDGIYVIEDLQTAFWPMFGGEATDGGATIRLATTILQQMHHAEIKLVMPSWQPMPFARSVRSVRAFHNLLVIEKGDNEEPSAFEQDPKEPHLARAREAMEAELMNEPTARGAANLALVLSLCGDRAGAERVTLDALERWPDHPDVLMMGVDTLQNSERRLELLERLARDEPHSSADLIRRARAAIANGEVTRFAISMAPPKVQG